MQTNLVFSFLFYFFPMKDLFLLSEKKIASQRLIFSHSVLTRLTLLLSILFEWEMVYVQWGACGKSQSSSQFKKKVCCEASDLHSVVRRINVEPFPFDVCEQLLLSDCKMHLIIVYSDTKKMLCSSIFEHETAASIDHNPETLRCTSRVHTNTHQGCFLKKTQESILHTIYRKV